MKLEWKTCFKIGLSVFLLFLCIHYWPLVSGIIFAMLGAATPLFIGCIIAYSVNILMSFYEKWYFPNSLKPAVIKSRRPVCMMAAFISLLAVISFIATIVIIQLIDCGKVIIEQFPDFMKNTVSALYDKHIISENVKEFINGIDWKQKIDSMLSVFTSGIGDVVGIIFKTVTSVFSAVVSVIIGFIFSIYLLLGKDRIGSQIKGIAQKTVPHRWYDSILHVLQLLNDSFKKYIIGQCTEALILGLLCTIGMLILRIPYPPMIGALVGVTAIIPIAGAYIGAMVGAFIILTVSPIKALVFLIFIVILQQLEGNIIYPRVVGSSIGLPGVWVLAAVTIGGGMFGILGMLFGVPIAATIYKLLKEYMNKKTLKTEEA